MNKTVTINISGIIFHIEEDAFDILSRYLSTIKGYFSRTDGGNEIMADIEARIAELLQEKINASKQVILSGDVTYVMGVMGKPEDFGSEQQAGEKGAGEESPQSNERVKRRLFRDPEEKAIGGVCSGLAAYFDIDTVWVRLIMFLLIFFGGLSLWVYVIMWIVIPEARTTADRFAMRGEPANVNSIFKSFKEEAEDVKNRVGKYGKEFKDQNYGERIRSNTSDILNTIFGIFGRLIGLVLVIIGGMMLVGYAGAVLGFSVLDIDNQLSNWKQVIFESGWQYNLAVLSALIVAGIPVFMVLYVGVKLLFRIRYSNRWLNMSLGFLWLAGLIVGFFVTMSTVKQFSQSSKLKETATLKGVKDTLIVKLNPVSMTVRSWDLDNRDDVESDVSHHHNGYRLAEYNKQLSVIGYAKLDVVEGTDSVEMIINYAAHGETKKAAYENAKAIRYSYVLKDNELVFDEVFKVMEGMKFSKPEVDITIKLPRGMVIYFDKSVRYLLNDIDNTTNTWDGDMVSRRWEMTAHGLKCIDCDDLEGVDGIRRAHREGLEMHHRGSRDADVKIDKDGIRIRSEDANVDITKEGIEVESRKEKKK